MAERITNRTNTYGMNTNECLSRSSRIRAHHWHFWPIIIDHFKLSLLNFFTTIFDPISVYEPLHRPGKCAENCSIKFPVYYKQLVDTPKSNAHPHLFPLFIRFIIIFDNISSSNKFFEI